MFPFVRYNTKIIGTNANDETDGAFYVIAAWGRVVAVTGDTSLEKDFFGTLKTYVDFYFTPGQKSDPPNPEPYWNATLGLLWTPHLEHSRLTRMWSAFDSLTNSFAIEAFRYMIIAAKRQFPGTPLLSATFTHHRNLIIAGLDRSLRYSGVETGNKEIYAELLGHVGGGGRDPDPMLFGMSWVQTAVINTLVANLSSAGASTAAVPLVPVEELGVSTDKLAATFETYYKSGSFLWVTEDEAYSALVQTTNVISSQVRSPWPQGSGALGKGGKGGNCSAPLRGKDALTLGQGADQCRGDDDTHTCGAATTFGECCTSRPFPSVNVCVCVCVCVCVPSSRPTLCTHTSLCMRSLSLSLSLSLFLSVVLSFSLLSLAHLQCV